MLRFTPRQTGEVKGKAREGRKQLHSDVLPSALEAEAPKRKEKEKATECMHADTFVSTAEPQV